MANSIRLLFIEMDANKRRAMIKAQVAKKVEHSRYPVPAYNVSPNKTSNVLLCDSG